MPKYYSGSKHELYVYLWFYNDFRKKYTLPIVLPHNAKWYIDIFCTFFTHKKAPSFQLFIVINKFFQFVCLYIKLIAKQEHKSKANFLHRVLKCECDEKQHISGVLIITIIFMLNFLPHTERVQDRHQTTINM